jgi:hypothetical protein
MHAFVLLSIGVHILDHLKGGGSVFIGGVDETLINQIGAGFLVAVLTWIGVTVRPDHWTALIVRLPSKQPPLRLTTVTPR